MGLEQQAEISNAKFINQKNRPKASKVNKFL